MSITYRDYPNLGWDIVKNIYFSDKFSLYSVAIFVGAWVTMGNLWSIIFSFHPITINKHIEILYLIIYLMIAISVVVALAKEFQTIRSKFKYIILFEILLFSTFVIAPPRTADAMRVWLAKVYDVWMNNEKIIRPYFHYNTPDAFALFHLPLIDFMDGQIFKLSIFLSLCCFLILFIKTCRIYCGNEFLNLALMLFLFNPLIILGSTVIITDMPVILAVSGIVYSMILFKQGMENIGIFILVLFLVFGLNIKYNMLMFIPAVIFWVITELRFSKITIRLVLCLLPLIGLAIYPYLMNYINIGNPVWPALTQYFPAHNPFWDEMANRFYHEYLGGDRNFINLISSLWGLLIVPHYLNPLTIILIFFVFKKYRYVNYMPAIIVVSYIIILWLMMPKFSESEKTRYILYLFPVMIPFGMSYVHDIIVKNSKYLKKKYIKYCVLFTVSIYFPFTVVYSYDAIKYLITYDKESWHRATWYYEDYEWINKNIELNNESVILVIASSQQTYYLRKKYINGDFLSAYIDWRKVTNKNSVISLINKYNIEYLYVDTQEINKLNTNVHNLLNQLVSDNILEVIRKSNVYLSSSRLLQEGGHHDTILYRIIRSDK